MKGMIVETAGGVIGIVVLVYDELITSGTNQYERFTMLAIRMADDNVIHEYPRNIIKVEHAFKKEIEAMREIQKATQS